MFLDIIEQFLINVNTGKKCQNTIIFWLMLDILK